MWHREVGQRSKVVVLRHPYAGAYADMVASYRAPDEMLTMRPYRARATPGTNARHFQGGESIDPT